MMPSRFLNRLFAGLLLTISIGSAGAVTLYDPALGSLPSAQGWTTSSTAGMQSVSGGLYHLDTTASPAVQAGSALFGVPAFDARTGFELDFVLRIRSETHTRPERGGFSVIVTGNDPSRALELAFWEDRVFAYTASFACGSEAIWTTTATTAYALRVSADRYALFGDGSLLLTGALVDYGGAGFPYTQPGLLFFGDDTTSAQVGADIGRIATTVAAVPESSSAALLLAGVAALSCLERRRRRE